VFGRGAPNIAAPLLKICSAGPNGIPEGCGGDDVVLGAGGTDAAGNFTDGAKGIGVSAPLTGGERLFAVDMQHGITGRTVMVLSTGQIPDLSRWGAMLLGLALLTAIVVRVQRVSRL